MEIKRVIKPIKKIGLINAPVLEAKIEANKQAINRNTEAIANIKSLDNLKNGDNIQITELGLNKVINTKDDLIISSLSARGENININSPIIFNNNAVVNTELQFKRENENAKIKLLSGILNIENTTGEVFIRDQNGVFSPRYTKTLLDQTIAGLSNAIIYRNRGNWDASADYVLFDAVMDEGEWYWAKRNNRNLKPKNNPGDWQPLAPTQSLNTYTKAEIDIKIGDLNNLITDNHNNILLNEGRIDGLTTDRNKLNERLVSVENEQKDMREDVSANTNLLTKITEPVYNFGENIVQGEKWNGKQVYIYKLNPEQDINLPGSGGALLISGVDEIISETIKVANPFGDRATASGWITIPCVDRENLNKQLNTMLETDYEYRILNYGITGNRRFKGYIKYTKI